MRVSQTLIVLFCLAVLPSQVPAQNDDRGFLTRQIEQALSGAGRDVIIEGFRGALSSTASFDRMTIADDQGIWLTLEDAALDWNRAALLRGRLDVKRLSAARLNLSRLPKADPEIELPPAQATPFELPDLPDLPVSVDIETFEVGVISLGEPVLGEALSLRLTASARLDDAGLDATLRAERIDFRQARVDAAVKYLRDPTDLSVKLDANEAADGILSKLLGLPGAPSVSLKLDGAGPPHDFAAQFALATDETERLSGRFTVNAASATSGNAISDRRIEADVRGDLTAVVLPEYRAFFGPDVRLNLAALRPAAGGLEISRFALSAQSARLGGALTLNSENWPSFLQLEGQIESQDGSPVLLPGGGGATAVQSVALDLNYDASSGDAFRGVFTIRDLMRDEIRIGETHLSLDGTLQSGEGVVGRFLGDLELRTEQMLLADPGISQAVGEALSAQAQVEYQQNQPVRISDLFLSGPDFRLEGNVAIDGFEGGFPTVFDLGLVAGDFSRLASLAQRPLAGAGWLTLAGTITPLAGMFDLSISGETQDLQLGMAQADALLQGKTQLKFEAARNTQGTFVRDLTLRNPALNIDLDAAFQGQTGRVRTALSLSDLGLVVPQAPGPLTLRADAEQAAGAWYVDAAAEGPFASSVQVQGLATGPEAVLQIAAAVENLTVLIPEISGPLTSRGQLARQAEGWQVTNTLTGPSGTAATLAGRIAEGGVLDLSLSGQLPLALGQPFVQPRTLTGQALFDLALKGKPGLDALSGTIRTRDARFSDPNLRLALRDITSDLTLARQKMGVALRANAATGGALSLDGELGLTADLPATLRLGLRDLILSDPRLYRTSIGAELSVNGALTGGARIAGKVEIGETLVTVPSSGLTSIGNIPEITHLAASAGVETTRTRANLATNTEASQTAIPSFPLAVELSAPGRIFVRGRGLDAELGGGLTLTGDTGDVISAGQFDLIRGRLDLLGRRFDLVEGAVLFQGGLTPFIRFVTSTQTDAGTVQIVLEGLADAPEVSFLSDPEAPQDEVLSQLLFGRDLSQISAFQALQLANAVAVLAGRQGADVIGRLRQGFGLDDLDVTTSESGAAQLRAGKYLSNNLYTNVTAAADGRADISLNLDLTPSLTARGTVGSDGETGMGLFFERDY